MDFRYGEEIQKHYSVIWNNKSTKHFWEKKAFYEFHNEFSILRFEPTKFRNMWTYATCGMSFSLTSAPIELHIFAPEQNDDLIELLTVVANYHITGSSLGLGHSLNFGRAWWNGSKCEYGLISLPYLDGPELEKLTINNFKVEFLWLIPITREEMEFKKKYGIDALEQKFDNYLFNYLNPYRMSVV